MTRTALSKGLPGVICIALFTAPALAQAPVESNNRADRANGALDNVTIIGHRRDVEDVAGSAHVVDREQLETFLASDIMRVLRTVPGVYLQEEDGYGLRPNIGIRGSGLDRSSRIALLEDGVLIAPAPYAASSAYYFPTQRRMHSLEVLKGPASIAVGPRTTGGAINMISTPIPDDFSASFDVRAGENATADAHVFVGDRGQRFSWLLETVQSRTDGFKSIDAPAGVNPGDTGFDIEDYVLKLQLDNDPSASLYQSLRFKGGYTDQVSDETYLGLTDDDFRADPFRRYTASSEDVFNGEHEQLQLSYVVESEGGWRAEVTAYRNDFARNWFKLQSVNGTGISSILEDPETYALEYGYITGATDSPDDTLFNRNNNREYYSQGVQADISWDLAWGDTEWTLTTGVRVHEDEEDRLQSEDGYRMEDGQLVLTSVGAPGSQTNRVSSAQAVSLFVDTQFEVGRWLLTPGVRFEDIETERLDFSTSDPDRGDGPTRVRTGEASVVIPGMGAVYRLNDKWRLLAGLHRGYNPPGPGSSAREEESVNVEAGTRYSGQALSVEAIYFLNDYENLVGTVTASTGGSGAIGDQFDGGEVTVQGLELNGDYAFSAGAGIVVPLSLQYTWTAEAEFQNGFESGYDPWGDVQPGDELPYIPEHQLRATAGLRTERFDVNLSTTYVDRMRTVAGQGTFVPTETIESHRVWDVLANWRFTDALSAYVKIDNLLDEGYAVARRPAGLRPGLPRTAYVGLKFRL